MIAAVRLGFRLAGAGAAATAGRARSGMVALAAAIGTLLMLAVVAIAHSETVGWTGAESEGMLQLLATVVVVVSLPVLVLAATAGRLAAALRDRRLANLRLLGMTPVQTRIVAAIETGLAASVGAVAGLAMFFPARAALGLWHPAGRPWSYSTLTPGIVGYLVVVVAVPLAVTLVSASTRGGRGRNVLEQSRRSDTRRPGWWRLAPLLIGVGLAIYTIRAVGDSYTNVAIIPWMFAAIALLGLGVVLVVPALVRLVADLLVRRRSRPVLIIAGRRLRAQPAATTRVVAGLLIGLFVVTGARGVVVAFEQTPQYQWAATIDTTGQSAVLSVLSDDAARIDEALQRADGIRAVASFPQIMRVCPGEADCWSYSTIVASCAQLSSLFGVLPDCRDDQPAWAGDHTPSDHSTTATFTATTSPPGVMTTNAPESDLQPSATVTTPMPTYQLGRAVDIGLLNDVTVVVPPGIPGVAAASKGAAQKVVAVAKPGVEILPIIHRAVAEPGFEAPDGFTAPDMSYYRFVAGLRALVWAIAAIVLSIGLLAFAIGAIDRAVSRRSELVALQLVGTSGSVLRRTQWIEAALPLGAGIILSIAAGSLAGAAFLAYGGEAHAIPWNEIVTLTSIALVAAVAVAGITVIAASPRIRPELIRTE